MNRLLLTTALILSTAAPALAQSQLERSLGVEPGRYSAHELARLKGVAQETGSEARLSLVGVGTTTTSASTSNMVNPRAAEIIAEINAAGDSGQNPYLVEPRLESSYTPQAPVNARAAEIIEEIRSQ